MNTIQVVKNYYTYPKYKSSGIDWLGNIPYSWQIKKLKFAASIIMGQSPGSEDFLEEENGLPFLQGNAEFKEYFPIPKYWCQKAKKICRENDILLSVRAPVGAINIADQKYGIGRGLCAIKGIFFDQKFLTYLLILSDKYLNIIATGSTFQAISIEDIKSLSLPMPDIKEQKIIANFLELKSEKINLFIAKKQKLIGLLKEKRTELINKAVTKGLNPNIKLKKTSIEWLRDIPESWNLKKLKHVVKAKKGAIKTGPFGSDLTRDDYVYDENSYAKIYTQKNIIENDLNIGDDYITEEKYLELIACTLEKDDVILTTRGTLGKSIVFTDHAEKGIMHPCLLRVQIDVRYCLKEFFQILIQESYYFFEQLLYISNATTIEVLYGDTLKSMQVALPSISEQKIIIEYVEQIKKRFDATIKKIEQQIEFIKDYRMALITNAVTGKIMIN